MKREQLDDAPRKPVFAPALMYTKHSSYSRLLLCLVGLVPKCCSRIHQHVRRKRLSKIPTSEMLHLHRSRLGWSRTLLFYRHVPATTPHILFYSLFLATSLYRLCLFTQANLQRRNPPVELKRGLLRVLPRC